MRRGPHTSRPTSTNTSALTISAYSCQLFLVVNANCVEDVNWSASKETRRPAALASNLSRLDTRRVAAMPDIPRRTATTNIKFA